jgi:hypothetical protein
MRQIPLGRTGLRVSEMIFGGAPIGGLYAPVTDDQAAAALEAAWTAGVLEVRPDRSPDPPAARRGTDSRTA